MFSVVAYEVIWITVILRFMLSTEGKLLQEIICRICRAFPLSECPIEIAGLVLLNIVLSMRLGFLYLLISSFYFSENHLFCCTCMWSCAHLWHGLIIHVCSDYPFLPNAAQNSRQTSLLDQTTVGYLVWSKCI